MNLQTLISFFTLITTLLFSSIIFSKQALATDELQQIMEFDQACIVMHAEGRKYLENKERIAQSYGASTLIEKHLETSMQEYSAATGTDIDDIRQIVFEKGLELFKELSQHQPKDLVNQCSTLVENIIKSNL